jgi:hypothetical protein
LRMKKIEKSKKLPYRLIFDDDNYWGHCANPEHENFYLNVGRAHWMVCESCRIKWLIGDNLFSSWRSQNMRIWEANHKKLRDYEDLSK